MSKNDNIVRVWTGDDPSESVGHWHFIDEYDGWHYSQGWPLYAGELFCLNDEDHPPPVVETDSLKGLV